MKRLTTYLITLVLLIVVGCNDLINKEPLGQVSTNSAYTSKEDALKALSAAYKPVSQDGLAGGAVQGRWIFGDVMGDNAFKGGFSGSDQLYAAKLSQFTAVPTNVAVGSVWQVNYIGVRRVNLVLENVPNIDMDQNLKTRITGEAKFLRGYYYFQLLKNFGRVPLILKTDIKTSQVQRASIDSIYIQIEKDFKSAAEVLPLRSGYSSSDEGRVTKGAAQAYLGKVYLYQKNFTKAEMWFKKVIDSNEYTLDPDYYHMFTIDGEYGSGNIFEATHMYSSKYGGLGNDLSQLLGSRGMYGWGFVNPTQDFVDAFEQGDPRLDQTVYGDGDKLPDGNIADIGNSVTGYLDLKGYLMEGDFPPSGYAGNSGKNELLMRLGKVLLWYAEAANENGHAQRALDALNRVRKRARQGSPNILADISTTGKAMLRKKIWHEERVEYGLEHERFFDLVRQDRAGKVLRNFAKRYNTDKGANFKDGINEIMPIPQSEIDLSNGKLTQNKGY